MSETSSLASVSGRRDAAASPEVPAEPGLVEEAPGRQGRSGGPDDSESHMRRSPRGYSRRFRRLEARRPCTFEYRGRKYPAQLLDLSHGGSFIEADFVPPEQAAVGLCLSSVPGRHELTFKGRVVHSGQYLESSRNFSGFGVEFEGMTKVLHGLVEVVGRRLCEAQSRRWAITLCQGPGRKS